MARLATVLLATAALSSPVAAQNSVYGVRGLGFPGRPVSVRARGLGSGYAMFDRMSAVNPATVGGFGRLTVSGTYGATVRSYTANDTEVNGLRETRFPVALLGANIGSTPVAFAVSFSTYMERSFDVMTEGTEVVNDGEPIAVEDRLKSDGGIADTRIALAWRVSPALHFGGAVHAIHGSSRVSALRIFPDSELLPFLEESELTFSGVGFSTGFNWRASPVLQVAGSVRYDTRVTSTVEDRTSRKVDLPTSVGAGAALTLTPRVRWSASAMWRSWGVASDSFDDGVFNTWEVGSGFEIGGANTHFPLRVGVRRATLPFSPTDEQPHEWNLALGTGTRFAAGRGVLDLTVERLIRDGAGATERGWHVAVGLTVQP